MKNMKAIIKNISVRLFALLVVLSFMPSCVTDINVRAEGEDEETVFYGTSEDETEDDEEDRIAVYNKDGQKQSVKLTPEADWSEEGVEGSEEPTLTALSPQEFCQVQSAPITDENIYTLTVATGMMSGDTVEYFAVHYLDSEEKERTKFLFPKVHSLDATNTYIKDMTKNIEKSGLTQLKENHKFLDKLGYKITEPSAPKALQAWSVDEYLFQTEVAVKQVSSIEVFMSKGTWVLQGISVSQVLDVGGYGEYGFYSGKYFISLGKKCLCRLKSKGSSQQHTFSPGDDTLYNIGGSDSAYYTLEQADVNEELSDPFRDLYTFRLDFADLPSAGLETLLKNSTSLQQPDSGTVVEDLVAEVEYKDKNGWTRNVVMPIILSVTGQYMRSGDKVNIMGLAQQGETLSFTACLPEFQSVISYKLLVGSKARERIKETGGITRKNTTDEVTKIETLLESDTIQLAGVSVYQGTCRMSNTEDGTDMVTGEKLKSCTYTFSYSSPAPFMYFTTTSANGYRIQPGTTSQISLFSYKTDDPLISIPYEKNLLVRLRTDTAAGSGTSGNLKVRLTYIDFTGTEKISSTYNVKQEVMDHIGTWYSQSDTDNNFGYLYGVSPGHCIEFPVLISDVAEVTKVEVSLDTLADEWQASAICVSALDSVSRRRIYKQTAKSEKLSSNYRIVRSAEHTIIPPFPIGMKLLITPGTAYIVTAGSNRGTETNLSVDYDSMRYSMTFEQTQYDFGYASTKKSYDVNVKVAKDSASYNANGDSGSKNQFYFQLCFKNGSSAFVLANQQLSSDGFRAGCNELFSVHINRDYHDLRAVRIIPEDISEDSDVFDKLNIEQITVTERTYGGTAMQYVIDDVGWIGIDYRDKAEDYSLMGREGRTMKSIAKKYTVSYKQSVVNLYCEIESWPWSVDSFDFSASLSANIEYIDQDDEPQTIGFDVISRMYDFMKKTPISFEAKADGSDQALYNNMGTLSDPEWMLRPNHTDRFSLPPLPNAKMLKSITFRGTNRTGGMAQWVIGGVSVYTIITDSEVISISENKEYYRKMELEKLCMMDLEPTEQRPKLLLPVGIGEPITIKLSDHIIPKLKSGQEAWQPAVSKFPDSTEDTLNMYLYPAENTRKIANVNVGMAVQYNLPFSKVMQVKQNPMLTYGSGTPDAVFYCTGLSADDMQGLRSISVSCRNAGILFDHVIINQVRENVIVNTYTMTLGKASGVLGLNASPAKSVTVYDKTRQKMLISFSPETEPMTLFGSSDDSGNINDIAVSFKYKSSLDKGMGENAPEYFSPYMYLTDAGIDSIAPGMMMEVPFDVPYVSEITGYRIVSFGNIKASLDSAMVVNYSYKDTLSTSKDVLENCYCIDRKVTVKNITQTFAVTAKGMTGEKSLNPVDIIFTTDVSQNGYRLQNDTKVTMTFNYVNSRGGKIAHTVDDIKAYIQSENKQFVTYSPSSDGTEQKVLDNKARIRLFLVDCNALDSITVKLSDTRGTAHWKVSNIEGSLMLGDMLLTPSETNKEFDSSGGTIMCKTYMLSTYVTANNVYKGRVYDHETGVTLESGQKLSSTVTIQPADLFDVKFAWIVGGVETEVPNEYYSVTRTKFEFTAPPNRTTQEQIYKITVSVKSDPAVKDIINVVVPVPEQQEFSSPTQESSQPVIEQSSQAENSHEDSTVIVESSTEESSTEESSEQEQSRESSKTTFGEMTSRIDELIKIRGR